MCCINRPSIITLEPVEEEQSYKPQSHASLSQPPLSQIKIQKSPLIMLNYKYDNTL